MTIKEREIVADVVTLLFTNPGVVPFYAEGGDDMDKLESYVVAHLDDIATCPEHEADDRGIDQACRERAAVASCRVRTRGILAGAELRPDAELCAARKASRPVAA